MFIPLIAVAITTKAATAIVISQELMAFHKEEKRIEHPQTEPKPSF